MCLQEESISGDSTANLSYILRISDLKFIDLFFFITWQICEQFIGETLAVETASEAMQVR